jgi:hypothetical protein
MKLSSQLVPGTQAFHLDQEVDSFVQQAWVTFKGFFNAVAAFFGAPVWVVYVVVAVLVAGAILTTFRTRF